MRGRGLRGPRGWESARGLVCMGHGDAGAGPALEEVAAVEKHPGCPWQVGTAGA